MEVGCYDWKSRKERGAGGRWKLSAYKVAIRRKWPCVRQEEHLCLLPQHTKDRGRGGWKKNHGPLHVQGPTEHHTLYFNGPIWGFQSRSSLAFEKARQEPAQWVTRGLEEESDLRGWRRRRSPPLTPPSQPVPYTLAGTCLFSGRQCGVMLNVYANLRKRTGEKNRPQHVEKQAPADSILKSKPP